MSKIETKRYKICGLQNRITVDKNDVAEWANGSVTTHHGIVEVYSEKQFSRKRGHTTLRFVYSGYEYVRWVDGYFSSRGLATMAGRFAQEVASGETKAE